MKITRHLWGGLALMLAASAPANPLEIPVLGPIALRTSPIFRADAEWVIEAGRPGLVQCILDAHARAPLAEIGRITINLRVHFGEVLRAATILQPPRADLARCLHAQVKALGFRMTAEPIHLRLATDWFAPPPPEQANYPYPIRRR